MPSSILIVDDSAVFREILQALVLAIDPEIEIDHAADAAQALDMIQKGEYDCVFLDYILPDMNGISVLHAIHDEQQSGIFLPPPIIMLTGSNDYKVITAAIKAGALDFMSKDQVSKNNLFIVMTKATQYYELKKSQKHAEEQLLQAQKMESVGLLAGGIAHDFNNLLTVIFGNIKLLSLGLSKLPDPHEKLIKNIDAIDRSARRGAGLVKRLMIFSRQRSMEPKPICMNAFLQDMSVLLAHSIGVSVEMETHYAQDLWPVYMDETQLGSAIMNIAINARDAMPDGGTLSFKTENISIERDDLADLPELEVGKYVALSITDTGSGISEDMIGKIFDPFFTTKDVGKGTGLGLSMVYGLIRESMGTIAVESEKGQGTCFKIYLPKSHIVVAQESDYSTDHEDNLGGSETILVVEDEEDIRQISASALKEKGYTVVEASDSAEALDILLQHKDNKFDLLFTDIAMPGDMNGIQLAARVAALKPDIKILFTSGYSENAVPDFNLIKEGQLISKPYDQDAMLQKVQHILQKGANPAQQEEHAS